MKNVQEKLTETLNDTRETRVKESPKTEEILEGMLKENGEVIFNMKDIHQKLQNHENIILNVVN